jgi:hypothetical protein
MCNELFTIGHSIVYFGICKFIQAPNIMFKIFITSLIGDKMLIVMKDSNIGVVYLASMVQLMGLMLQY